MKSKYFKIYELVPQHIYRVYKDYAWKFLNPKILETIDVLKEHFPNGTIKINDYYWGGIRKWSGWRTPLSPDYSETSQHSLGNAVDCIFSEYDVAEVRQFIIYNPDLFPHVKGIELDVPWLHIDVRNEKYLVKFSRKG